MKVAFCIRPSWNDPMGGDGVQMIKTKEKLEELYHVKIDIIVNAEDLTDEYDIVHVFNFSTVEETDQFITHAHRLGIPIVGSSIFWDYTFCSAITRILSGSHTSKSRAILIKLLTSISSNCFGYPKLMSVAYRKKYRSFCDRCAIILPNSDEEGQMLQRYIGHPDILNKIRIVYNGTETRRSIIMDKDLFFAKYKIPQDYVLQVGRIETLKNQLNLIYSLMTEPMLPIVIVGRCVDKAYFDKVRRLAAKRGNVFFINAVPHDEIDSFYHYARLHVLLSFRESPGLVSLEALKNNCPIVVASSPYTPVKTYFADQPYVVDPFDTTQIRKTIVQAYHEQRLVTDGLINFTWDVAAKQTYATYHEIMSHKV